MTGVQTCALPIYRNVSGIVLFGKTSKGASRLSEQFRSREIKKIYHAVIEGEVKPISGTLIHYLKKDEDRKIALVSDTPKPDYDRSELSYKTLLHTANYSLLSILLKTGRFHQIRAQFSAIDHPIVGDTKYLPVGRQVVHLKDGSIALCSTEVEFKTATTDEIKNIKIDYPSNWEKYLK